MRLLTMAVRQACGFIPSCFATVLQLLASESFHKLKKSHLGMGVSLTLSKA
ncbi:MAG: hypothetical protein QMC46_00630 [Burkholderiaceae bacterium]